MAPAGVLRGAVLSCGGPVVTPGGSIRWCPFLAPRVVYLRGAWGWSLRFPFLHGVLCCPTACCQPSRAYKRARTHTHTHTHTCTHMHIRTHMHAHAYTCTHTHTHTYTPWQIWAAPQCWACKHATALLALRVDTYWWRVMLCRGFEGLGHFPTPSSGRPGPKIRKSGAKSTTVPPTPSQTSVTLLQMPINSGWNPKKSKTRFLSDFYVVFGHFPLIFSGPEGERAPKSTKRAAKYALEPPTPTQIAVTLPQTPINGG